MRSAKIFGGILIALLIISSSSSRLEGQQRELVVASYGSIYEDTWRTALIQPFEKKYNARVVYIPGASFETIAKIAAQSARPQIDVAILDADVALTGNSKGLFSRIDPNLVPNLARIYDSAKDPNGLGVRVGYSTACLYYNTQVFKEKGWNPPTSWYDLWDPKFKGHVTFHSIVNGFGLRFFLMMAILEGKSIKNVEPAIAKIKTLVPNAITIDRQADTPRLIQQGEAWIGTWGLDRVGSLAADGFPIACAIPKEGSIEVAVTANIVRGAPHRDLAEPWIDMLLSDEVQFGNAKALSLGPVNRFVKLPPDVERRVVYGEAQVKKLIQPDWLYVVNLRPLWTDMWNREIER